MGNSKTTASNKTSKSTINPKFTPAANQTIFDIGDVVLCPSLSNSPFVLIDDPHALRDDLTLEFQGSCFYYNNSGYFIRANQDETSEFQPSLFHDTPANRQAIAMLYHGAPLPKIPSKTNDIVMPVATLKSIADEMDGASQALHDVSLLLHMIHQEKINPSQIIAMARLAHDSTNAWSELLYHSLESVNQTLSSTHLGNAGAQL